ncbi:Histone-lysine N-methyltransferase setd3 [Coemansia erecta]|nr:Histone-lysine N-methyltransferase setd3 [Coemansia erecta]
MAHETTNGQRLAAFVRWLEDNGADLGRIGVCDAGAEGNGVYAQQDISSNERYAYIPHKLVITGKVCQQTLGDGLQGRALLAAFLVHERFVAADSFWKPYIDILPQKYHTPLEFDSLELALLGGTPVEHAVEDRRSKYKEEHRAAQRATEGRIPGDVLTLENYVWAASAVSSRAFSKELVRGYDEQTASSEMDVDPDVTLALFVVRVLTTAGTPWHDAVVRLHTVFRHPMMSTDQHCVDAYGEMLVEMGEIYDDLFPLLSDHFPEVFPIDAFTAERFVWAAAVVESFRVEVSVRSEKGCTVDAVCLL